MHHIRRRGRSPSFEVLHATATAEAALMTLRPGQSTLDKPENEHPRCEQWLYVLSGAGRATVGRSHVSLKEGSLLVIEKGEPHRITNTGRKALVTLNFYAPPAYTKSGDLRTIARIPTVIDTLKKLAR